MFKTVKDKKQALKHKIPSEIRAAFDFWFEISNPTKWFLIQEDRERTMMIALCGSEYYFRKSDRNTLGGCMELPFRKVEWLQTPNHPVTSSRFESLQGLVSWLQA